VSSIKSLKVVHGLDTCTLLLYDKTEHASLVHALTSRFQLGQLPFYLTHCGDDDVVPLSSELPPGLTLFLHVDETALRERSKLTAQEVSCEMMLSSSTVEPVLSTRSFLDREDEHGSTKGIAMRSIPNPEGVFEKTPTFEGCTPLLQERCSPGNLPASASVPHVGPRSSPTLATSKAEVVPIEPQSSNASINEFNMSTLSNAADDMNNVVQTIDRMSRISSELANERTLLAWIRTGLAAIRTVFAFLSVAAETEGWKYVFLFAEMAMMTVVLLGSMSGTIRYFRVRKALRMQCPQEFGRHSIMWFNSMVVISSVAIAAGIYSQNWIHGR